MWITCLHTCVSALIWNMFGGSSSTSELILTWLYETPALIGPTYSNYRLPGRGGWHSQSASPAKRPCCWGRKWPYMDTPSGSVALKHASVVRWGCCPTITLLCDSVNNTGRIMVWILVWKNMLFGKTEIEGAMNEGEEERGWERCCQLPGAAVIT